MHLKSILPALPVMAGLVVAGCGLKGKPERAPAVSSILVTADQIALRAPVGFCVDPKTTRDAAQSAFVVFGNCAAIADNAELEQPFVQAVVTAVVIPTSPEYTRLSANGEKAAEFFKTEAGRALLSRTKAAQTVSVAQSFSEDGVVFLRAQDKSAGLQAGLSDSYWRSYIDMKSSLVVFSVLGTKADTSSPEERLELLREFVQKTRSIN